MIKSSICVGDGIYDKETAVCNLASIALPQFVKQKSNVWNSYDTIRVYSKTTGKYCKMVKERLTEFGYLYEEIIMDDDEERKLFYKEQSEKQGKEINSVPQVFVNDVYIGGYENVVEYLPYVFDYERLHKIEVLTENLNNIIDCNLSYG